MADTSDESESVEVKVPITQIIVSRLDRMMTRKSTHFSLSTWETWRERRYNVGDSAEEDQIPDFHTACSYDVPELDLVLTKYVNEVKCKDGQEYLEESLRGLLHGLQRYMKCYCEHFKQQQVTFMKNPEQFPKFSEAFQQRLQACRSRPHTANNNRGITKKQEEALWEGGSFGIDSAETLSDTIFFYVVKIFEISASGALRNLLPEDFEFSSDEQGEYVELDLDFALRGAVAEPISHFNFCLKVPNTNKLRHYCNPKNPRSFYNLIKFYTELIKLIPRSDNFGFFLMPKSGLQFRAQPIGKNVLQKKFASIMRMAGYTGNFTIQSMVQSYIPLLQQNGYRLKKTQLYTPEEHLDISRLLDPPEGPVKTIQIEKVFEDCLKAQPGAKTVSPLLATGPYVITSQSSITGDNISSQATGTKLAADLPLYMSFKKITECNKNLAQLPGRYGLPQRFTLLPLKLLPSNAQASIPAAGGASATHSPLPPSLSPNVQAVPPSIIQSSSKPCFPTPIIIQQQTATVQQPVNIVTATQTQPVPLSQAALPTPPFTADECADKEIEHIDRIISEAIKDDPVEYEYNVATEAAAILSSHDDLANTSDTRQDNHKDNHSELNQTSGIKRKTDISNVNPSSDKKRQRVNAEMEEHTAIIQYSVTNNPAKNLFKHEISVHDDDQTAFSFNNTSKAGKTTSDLDFNLGDYLPENSVIKPQDIDLQRITMPDGGMFKLTVKYSMQK